MQICSRCNIIMPDDKEVETLLLFLTSDRLDVCHVPYSYTNANSTPPTYTMIRLSLSLAFYLTRT